MVKRSTKSRRFEVHTHHGDGGPARVIREASLEAAAVAFVEEFGMSLPPDEHQVRVFVRDLAGGHEHCFKIDLDTAAASPCK